MFYVFSFSLGFLSKSKWTRVEGGVFRPSSDQHQKKKKTNKGSLWRRLMGGMFFTSACLEEVQDCSPKIYSSVLLQPLIRQAPCFCIFGHLFLLNFHFILFIVGFACQLILLCSGRDLVFVCVVGFYLLNLVLRGISVVFVFLVSWHWCFGWY